MDMTNGKISNILIRFTLPIIVLQILNQAYSLVDNVIVARFISEEALSILSVVNSSLLIGYCLMQGFSAACNILVGNLVGKQDKEGLKKIQKLLLLISLLTSVIVCLIYCFFARSITSLLKVPSSIQEQAIFILRLYAITLPPTYLVSSSTAICNGLGNSKTPMIASLVSQIINIILDYIVIVKFGMGIEGAALASLFSVCFALIWTTIFLRRSLEQLFHTFPNKPTSLTTQEGIRRIIYLAFPSIIQQSVIALGTMILQTLVNQAGSVYINGYTIANTINSLFLIFITSCCVGFETFAAQNIGAKKLDRVKQGFITIMLLGICISILLTVINIFTANQLIGLYLKDIHSETFNFAKLYLFSLIPFYFITLFKNEIEGLFKAHMKVHLTTISSFITLITRIIFSFYLSSKYGLIALAWSQLIGSMIGLLFDYIVGIHVLKSNISV